MLPAAPGTRKAARKAYTSPHGDLRELEGSKCQALERDMVLTPFIFKGECRTLFAELMLNRLPRLFTRSSLKLHWPEIKPNSPP